MFKNAEYRISLSKNLASDSDGKLKGGMVFEDGRIVDTANAQVKGKLRFDILRAIFEINR